MLRKDSKLMTTGPTVAGIGPQTNAHTTKSPERDEPRRVHNTCNDEVQHSSDLLPWLMQELIKKYGLARN